MKSFNQREKVLLGVLLVLILGAAYYFLFFQPVQTRLAAAELRVSEADNALMVEQARAVKYAQMKKEIEEMKAKGEESSSEIPDYNNLRSVMLQLDSILSLASSYDISFPDIVVGDRTISRPIHINFTAGSYQTAKQIIQALSDCRFRCTVDGVEMQEGDSQSEVANIRTNMVEASVVVTFYERNTMPKPAPAPVETTAEPPAA